MKKNLIILMATAIVLAAASVASVHAQDGHTVSVNIPFDFTAGKTNLPAGEYYVRRIIERAQVGIEIRGKEKSKSVLLLAPQTVRGTNIQNESKLVFNRYGDQYFLAQLWIAGRSDGNELTKTARERLLGGELARRDAKRETVNVAARAK